MLVDITYKTGIRELEGYIGEKKVKKVLLGTRELSKEEIKYIDDTIFWNNVENIDTLKKLEEELEKNSKNF